MYSLKILVPNVLSNKKEVFFKGYISTKNDCITIYVTKFSFSDNIENDSQDENTIYGYYSKYQRKRTHVYQNYLMLTEQPSSYSYKLYRDSKIYNNINSCIIMLYDYKPVKNSETIGDSDEHFSKLQYLVQSECGYVPTKIEDVPLVKTPFWLTWSMFAQHLLNYMNLMKWLVSSFRRDKKFSIKQRNLLLAIITDIVLGYLILELLSHDKKELSSILMGLLEKLVNSLYSLLKWLMGAPAGLKLNNAFNKMLGKYFSYHIQLWWLFLDVSGEKLDTILHIYHYIGYMGFTVQAAIISDMICICTFHSYCIYVYAARLFNIQILGLIALLRLFVGRKYNPLRGGIDSCEYTNQELFVGTVAFTILLLLLPTTAMYYIVFTMFRLLSLVVQSLLAKLIYLVQTLPLYVTGLWLTHSSKVAGNVLIEVVSDEKPTTLVLKAKFFKNSLAQLVNQFTPPVEVSKPVQWTNLLSNVVTGRQII